MLKTPLIPVGFSGKYPTKTGALKMPGIRGNFNFGKVIISSMLDSYLQKENFVYPSSTFDGLNVWLT